MTDTPKPGEAVVEELTQEQKDAAAAAAYRAQLGADEGANTGEIPQRPEHIPEKFWDAEKGEVRLEELAKSYTELEKGKVKPEGEVTPPSGEIDPDAAARAEEFSAHREKMTDKLLAGEAFSDEDYAPLEKMGLSREDVDVFAEGLRAIGELHKLAVHNEVGGEAAYTDMLAWAKSSFNQAEVEAYNRDVHSQDKAVSLNAVRGLAARYRLATGTSGRDVTGGGGGRPGADGYKSKAEMVSDMRKPEYTKDAAFREEVARKVQAARAAGVDLTH